MREKVIDRVVGLRKATVEMTDYLIGRRRLETSS
jgi:hypothetical protein